nr:MAG TPA: bacterial surface protein [Caudoviricetes sp.]
MKKWKKFTVILLAMIMALAMTVPVSAATVKINKTKVTICTGQTLQLKMVGTKAKPKWSSNSRNAIVNNTGKVTAKTRGTATITAKIGKKSYRCLVTVEAPKISSANISLYKGKTAQLKMLNTKQKYRWTSSNTKVVTVSPTGKISGKSTGTAYVSARSASGKTFKCKVAVKNTPSKLKMLLPNQKECGDADFFIEYNSQRSTNGKIILMQLYKQFPMGYINFSVNNAVQGLTTYIYIDGKLWDQNTGTSVSGGGSLDDIYIKTGTHVVEMVQFANNNRYGKVESYRRAMYKVIYK